MQQEYIFALGFLALAIYNGLRAWWNLRTEVFCNDGFKLMNGWNQRVIIGMICIVLGVVALVGSGYMGYQGWLTERRMAQVESSSPGSQK